MRRLFIIRKDLGLGPGKLAAMVAHCAEGFWTSLLKASASKGNIRDNPSNSVTVSVEIPKDVWNDYVNGIFTKTICEAKNLNHLMKAVDVAKGLGMVENVDYGFIDDACLTELAPEFTDEQGRGRCRVGIWFRPMDDGTSHTISKKYQLYRDRQPVEKKSPDKE